MNKLKVGNIVKLPSGEEGEIIREIKGEPPHQPCAYSYYLVYVRVRCLTRWYDQPVLEQCNQTSDELDSLRTEVQELREGNAFLNKRIDRLEAELTAFAASRDVWKELAERYARILKGGS
jgi:uncharacterized small protein (DUF1192 family)